MARRAAGRKAARLARRQVQRERARALQLARMQHYEDANSHNYGRAVELRADFDMFRGRKRTAPRDSDIPSSPSRADVSVSYTSR